MESNDDDMSFIDGASIVDKFCYGNCGNCDVCSLVAIHKRTENQNILQLTHSLTVTARGQMCASRTEL
eukprot:1188843-Prorocentrum_minimum.AAC.3